MHRALLIVLFLLSSCTVVVKDDRTTAQFINAQQDLNSQFAKALDQLIKEKEKK